MKLFRTSWFVGLWCADCLRDIFLTGLWLLLAGALALQIYFTAAEQLAMPDWLLRKFEARAASAGLVAQIGSATVDATGRVYIKDLQLTPPALNTPLITVESLHLQLNLRALANGTFAASDLKAGGVNFWLPAMLSPSGQSEPVISDTSISIDIQKTQLTFHQLSGRMANLTFFVRGTVNLPADLATSRSVDRGDLISLLVRQYLSSCRQLADLEPRFAALDSPHLDLNLVPSGSSLATATATLSSRNTELDLTPYDSRIGRLQLTDLRASATFPLVVKRPAPMQVRVSCARALSSTGIDLHNLVGALGVTVAPGYAGINPRELALTCESAGFDNFAVNNLSARVIPGPLPRLDGELIANALDTGWHIRFSADPKTGEGSGRIEGALTPWIVRLIAAKIGMEADQLLHLSAPVQIATDVGFAKGWKLHAARGQLVSGPVVGYGVPIDSLKGTFAFDGRNLEVSDIVVHQGENLAFGSYAMDTSSNEFRFLLNGWLRPPDIGGWFSRWWPDFWSDFNFDAGLPMGNADIRGRWGFHHLTHLFVHADVPQPVIRSVPFDRVRLSMFIRPGFFDTTGLIVNRGGQEARGVFTYSMDVARDEDAMRTLDFDVTTNLDLNETARLLGPAGTEIVEPFTFAKPPELHLSGRLDGPASPGGPHRNIKIDLRSTGAFGLFGFPLSNLQFQGMLRDDNINIDQVEVSFAQGQARGNVHLAGPDTDRRLDFDVTLKDAALGESIRTLEEYFAKEKGQPIPNQSRFQQQVATGRLNLHLAAKGLYANPLSYRGEGSIELNGAQLAEIKLLGALSELLNKSSLNFTSLQLTTARSDFTLDRANLALPDLRITGPSARIDAKGTVQLDKMTMNLNAKVYPFSEGKTLLASAVGFVLVPLSNALELKLIGTIDRPLWLFAYSPNNFLHTLAGSKNDTTPPAPPPSELRRLPPPYLRR